jgi:uncharacterized protein DUF6760
VTYPADQALEEVAFIAYHFHWSREESMCLPHRERRRWVAEISRMNRAASEA